MKHGIRFTLEEVKHLLEEKGYALISKEYINAQTNIIFKDKEGFFYYSRLGNVLHSNSPSKFHINNPFTIQNINNYLKINNINLELVSEKYGKNKDKLTFKDEEGYFYFATINVIRVQYPRRFDTSNPYTIQNIKLWCKTNLNNKPFELLSDKYYSNDKKLKWKCLKEGCGEFFESGWNRISNYQGCPFCVGKQVGLSNCLATKRPELAKEWHPTKNGKLTAYHVTCTSNQRVWWKCNEDDTHEWKTVISNRNYGSGCPKCKESRGEKKIESYLNSKNIHNIYQKTFDDLFGLKNGYLSYDFYLPDYNLLIEYQGEFHDDSGNYYVKQNLDSQQEHDRRKREYVKKHSIRLLEIWYYDFENIEEILGKELNIEKEKDVQENV